MKIRLKDMERILILCAAALVVVLALRGTDTTETINQEVDLATFESTTADSPADMQETVVFYQDGEGYLVPVTRRIEKTEGIAKATLALMVKSAQNDLDAARLGLRTVIPEGTTFDVDISNGKARVDLSKESLAAASLEDEQVMVQGVTGAMTCFSNVKEVEFLFDGQKRSKLKNGLDVSSVMTRDMVNLESVSTLSTANADQVQLYFPSQTGRVLVPVSRTVFSTADLTTAMVELAKGPKEDSGLERPLPKDCGIKGVDLKNGVATINFSKTFMDISNDSDGGKQALRAILFTASHFPGVKKVEIQVEGEKFTPPEETQTTFINQADEVMAQYPGVVEID